MPVVVAFGIDIAVEHVFPPPVVPSTVSVDTFPFAVVGSTFAVAEPHLKPVCKPVRGLLLAPGALAIQQSEQLVPVQEPG